LVRLVVSPDESEDAVEHWLSIFGIRNERPALESFDDWGGLERGPGDLGDVPF
jgi:hypothetical protein